MVYQFRAYCCSIDSDSLMGVSKQPVPVLDISPNPVCLGDAISWDLSNSYAPGSAIVSYAIDMDDGTQYFVASGALIQLQHQSLRDWAKHKRLSRKLRL
ncbi:MAG: hypothetical protein ACXAB9_14720 [Candidatus Thorarchaeota archaeon]